MSINDGDLVSAPFYTKICLSIEAYTSKVRHWFNLFKTDNKLMLNNEIFIGDN